MQLLLLAVFLSVVSAFQSNIRFSRFGRLTMSSDKGPIVTAAPYGTKFLAAEVGVPAAVEEYGGGDVGGNDYKDALYQNGVRKDVPPISENAVVKVPNMLYVERGYSEAKAAAAFKAERFKEGKWSKEEDAKLIELVAKEKEGVRGRWVRISKILRRSTQDCSLRWYQNLNPDRPTAE